MKILMILMLSFVAMGCRYYELEKGQVFRSPQPTAEQIEQAVAEVGLKSIINLRGSAPGKMWWEEEREATQKLGVQLIDISMSAKRLPHRKDLIKLLDSLRDAPRPLLIHCMAGVDRTGEASAIFQMIYHGQSKEQALEMLSPSFGHFEKLMPAKRYFIGDVWQGEDWARTQYDPCKGQYRFYDSNNSVCRGGAESPIAEDEDT